MDKDKIIEFLKRMIKTKEYQKSDLELNDNFESIANYLKMSENINGSILTLKDLLNLIINGNFDIKGEE